MADSKIKGLYYITHIANVPSILKHGILSHRLVREKNLPYTPIYDSQIVAGREKVLAPNGRSLWEFANLYLNPRNAMLFRVIHEKSYADIVVVQVKPDDLLRDPDVFVTTGGAASPLTQILSQKEALKRLPGIVKETQKEWWKPEDGSKRKIMAECLVPDRVPPDLIQAVYVATNDVQKKAEPLLPSHTRVIPDPYMFFQPLSKTMLTTSLSLIHGDMFFSHMQTLTISVNCVGVMGKGLASRTKYQFPDVYVQYQDLCRRRSLKLGKPYLLKLEFPFDQTLADEPGSLHDAGHKSFLLFPTKDHWRENSELPRIEQGLQWIQDNYKKLGVTSLATPALGCGLGGLSWHDVGPLLCHYLSNLGIDVAIYLPREEETPKEELTPEFLLGKSS